MESLPKRLIVFREGGFHLRALAHIAVQEHSVATGILAAGACGLGSERPGLGVDLGDDLGSLLGKALGRGAADAGASAGDECNFSRQAAHALSSGIASATPASS